MHGIWRALVDDPAPAISEHLEGISKELLRGMGDRLWRHREASCAGLAELVQGRAWGELEGFFAEAWGMAFRALDDVKVQ
jgi:proteasome component ECM29